MADAGVPSDAAGRIPGGLHAQLPRRIGVHEVSFQHASLDHHGASRGDTLVVKWRCSEQARNCAVVDYGQFFRRHFFANLAG